MKTPFTLLALSFLFFACDPELSTEPSVEPDGPQSGLVDELAESQQAATIAPPACQSFMWHWGSCKSNRPITLNNGQPACQVYWWSVARYSNGFKTSVTRTALYGGTCGRWTDCPSPNCS